MAKPHDELINILKEDHQKVKEIFGKLEQEKEASRREEIVKKLHKEIEPHMAGEEEAFYPALKKTEEGKEIALEAIEEHNRAKAVLKEILDMYGSDKGYQAKAAKLKELIFHHIEKEESKVFSVFGKVLKSAEAQGVLDGFKQAKSRRQETMRKKPAMA